MNWLCRSVWLYLLSALVAQVDPARGPHTSPFRGMRLAGDQIEVQVDDDTWWSLVAVAGVEAAELWQGAQRLCGDAAWKRVTEDLPALLAALGHPVGEKVDVVLCDLVSKVAQARRDVVMTGDNRRRLLEANRRAAGRVVRAETEVVLSAADVHDDLQELRRLLDERFAYRDLRGVDVDGLLAATEQALGDRVALSKFTEAVATILRTFGDGHSHLLDVRPAQAPYLPFLVQHVEGGHVAFLSSREGFVDQDHPYLVALDGVPLAKWLAAAQAGAPAGSPTMQARAAERGLRDLGALRRTLALPAAPQVVVTLRGPDGECQRELAVATQRPVYGVWPNTTTRRLADRFGYLRLAEMRDEPAWLADLDAAMHEFRTTDGLVIDVRGNGGGTRDALHRLAPYLLDAPTVGNVAALRLPPGQVLRGDALADRGLHVEQWAGYSAAQREAVAIFARHWQPKWPLPAGQFSAWHYLVLDPAQNRRAFRYARPVALLIDRGCYSATDVFAAALGLLPHVTLFGESTSGGSGRARRFTLPRSRIALQLSSMASYRPDGELFELAGVTPEIAVANQPGDLVGSSDTVLARAVDWLRAAK